MKFNKRILVTVSLACFATGSIAAALHQPQVKDQLSLCNSSVITCNVTLSGNGDGLEPPLRRNKKKN